MRTDLKRIYVDIPEVSETFADSFRNFVFDGQVIRIEFCATRLDDIAPNHPPTAKQYPACRLVLTAQAMLEMYNQLGQMIGALEKEGKIKREVPTPPSVQ